MRSRAALVPLAATTAAIVLFATAAWAQTEDPATPEPTVTETPTPEPTVEESQPPDETEVEEGPDPSPSRSAVPKKEADDDSGSATSREDDRPDGAIEVAAQPQSIQLYAAPKAVKVGNRVHVWGNLGPDGGGRWVQIINAATNYKLASFRTAANGTFDGYVRIKKNVAIRARFEGLRSDWRHLSAVPKLQVHMSATRLFGRTKISGKLNPITTGKWVKLKLRRTSTGGVVEKRTIEIGKRGRFSTHVGIDKPGTYRASVVFAHDKWRRASDKSGRSSTPLPYLSRGSTGVYVKLLERRLTELRHHLKGRNSSYAEDTSDAVMAFNKVHGRSRVSYVTSDTWKALARASRPQPRFTKPGFHIEVNQSKQVLYVVKGGKVRSILHVSTGAPSTPTYDGTYQFWGKIAGYSPKRLYYPSYFHGARAIHGWPEVPPYNASHGCVRVPMWAAQWIYGKADIDDTIRVYH